MKLHAEILVMLTESSRHCRSNLIYVVLFSLLIYFFLIFHLHLMLLIVVLMLQIVFIVTVDHLYDD